MTGAEPASFMEAVFRCQPIVRERLGLQKVKAARNTKYQHHGTKSYVSALNRYGFQTTKPGPYYQTFESPVSSKNVRNYPSALQPGLLRWTKDNKPAEVTAEDQQNDTEYLCEVLIGTPAKKLVLDFDTGSADFWVNREKIRTNESCTFQLAAGKRWRIQYGDGSSASGVVGTDNVLIGGLVVDNQTIQIADDLSPQFTLGSMDGVLGLGFRHINTIETTDGKADPQPTLVDNMISQREIPEHSELFTCALYSAREPGEESFYTFGWIDQDLVKQSGQEISWTRIDSSHGLWMFPSRSATVNGKTIIMPSGNKAIADTGTTLVLVLDEICEALYEQIKGAWYSEEHQGYIIPKDIAVNELPEFRIAVGDKEFAIQKEDLLFSQTDEQDWYGGVQSRGRNPFDILGHTFLKSVYAIWDQGNSRFGAVPRIRKAQHGEAPPSSSRRDSPSTGLASKR